MTATELAAGVWRLDLDGGRRAVAKRQPFAGLTRGRADDLLAVEQRVLYLLRERKCPVPRVIGSDPSAGIIFFEHVGDETLDDAVRCSGRERLQRLRERLVSGFLQLEQAFAECRQELEPHVSPAAPRDRLPAALDQARAGGRNGLHGLLGRWGQASSGSALRELEERLDELCSRLAGEEPSLGSTDYNARNVVVDPGSGSVSFIEFAKIGWDWPERRLVQYATGLGAGALGGFAGLLDRTAAGRYARAAPGDRARRAFALDGHHILFHLNAAARLCGALDRPGPEPHRALLKAWRQPDLRLGQLCAAVAAPLGDDTMTTGLRRQFARLLSPEWIVRMRDSEPGRVDAGSK
ncbi:MAG: phosphotransferase [Gemmatimonadetes bacterium]|nr:phosphotransferase [Gemmatimonadota bacterium]